LLWTDSPQSVPAEDDPDRTRKEQELCDFVDRYIVCAAHNRSSSAHAATSTSSTSTSTTPNDTSCPLTPELVRRNTHKHTRTCKQKHKKKIRCRFRIPLPPMRKTCVLRCFGEDAPNVGQHEKNWDRVQSVLQTMFEEHRKDSTALDGMCFDTFLKKVKLSEDEYLDAVRASLTSNHRIFLKRAPNEIRINAYNPFLLSTWEANMDIQLVTDMYGCAQYIAGYLTKGHGGLTKALEEAVNTVGLDQVSQWRHIGNKFLKASQFSVQEAVYYLLGLPFRRATRSFIFVNTSAKEKRVVFLKSQKELDEMEADSLDIESENLLSRYAARPASMEDICLAYFAAWYEWVPKTPAAQKSNQRAGFAPETGKYEDENDAVEQEEDRDANGDAAVSSAHAATPDLSSAHAATTLFNFRKRKHAAILRCVRFDRNKDPDNYIREQLMMYLPWRDEDQLLSEHGTYQQAYLANKDVVDSQRLSYEPMADAIDSFLGKEQDETSATDDTASSKKKRAPSTRKQYDIAQDLSSIPIPNTVTDAKYYEMVARLNVKQRTFFNHVLYWMQNKPEEQFTAFLSGGAGTGKTHLSLALIQMVQRCFRNVPGHDPLFPSVLSVAFSGKAAMLLNGTTIHSAFGINPYTHTYCELEATQWNTLSTNYSQLKFLIIDEVSMVSNNLLATINRRLQEIKGNELPFGGVHVLFVG
jgi:DNA replication protein DnaC